MTGTRFVALLALAEPGWVPPDVLGERIRDLAPETDVHIVTGASQAVGEGENYLISLGDRRVVTVAFLDHAIPLDTFAEATVPPAAAADALGDGIAGHRGAIVLGTLRAAISPESALAAAEALTLTAAALSELQPAVAVYWAEADLVTTPADLRDKAVAMGADYRPVDIWTSLRLIGDPGAPPGLVSKGFAPFAGREIEFPPADVPVGLMAQAIWALMLHLLDAGPSLVHGQSLALSETEIVRVRLANEGADGAGPVYRLSLEAAPEPALAS
jgi:hypothetical protein